MLSAYEHKLEDNRESNEKMQLLIENLEAEKRALNERLREANIRKIEIASAAYLAKKTPSLAAEES
jgi:hypothetical protein